MEFSFDFEMTEENKKAIEKILQQKGIKHYVLETKNKEKIDLVEYKNYQELEQENKILNENNQSMQEEMAKTWAKLDKKEEIINEAREYINKTKYSDIVGLNSYSINEFWFIKELLEILKESDK